MIDIVPTFYSGQVQILHGSVDEIIFPPRNDECLEINKKKRFKNPNKST